MFGLPTYLRVALIYALFSAIWIVLSDRLLASMISDHALLTQIQTYKGWGFVGISALLIYFLLRRELQAQRRTEGKLTKSEEEYRFLFENNPHPMWVYDLETLKFLSVNGAAIEKYGYTRQEFLSMTIEDIRPQEDIPRLRKNLERPRPALEYTTGWRHRLKDGSLIHVEIASHQLEMNGRQAVLVVAEDVTERKMAEDALRHSEERYRSTLNNMLEGCQIIDFDWRYIYINEAAAQHGHKTPTELLMRTMMEAYPGIENTKLFETLRVCMEGRITAQMENEFSYEDGTSGWFELSIQPVPEGIFILSIDITERKQAEEELRRAEERFQQLADNIEEVSWITDAETGRELYVSPAYEKVWGRKLEHHLNTPNAFIESTLPEDRALVLAALERQKRGESTQMEYRIQRPDGSVRWIWDRGFPVFDETGSVARVVGVASDITERKLAEEAIHHSEQRFRKLIENGLDNISLLAADGSLLWESPSATRMLSYQENEFVNRNIFELMHPDDLEWTQNTFREVAQEPNNQRRGEFRLRRADGSWRWVEALATNLLEEPSVHAIVINYRDITERKQAEEHIQRQLNRLKALREIDRIILSSLDLNLTTKLLLGHVVEQLGVDAAAILKFDPNTYTLEYVAEHDLGEKGLIGRTLQLGDSLAGRVAMERHTVIIPNLQAESHSSPFLKFPQGGFSSYFGLPLIAKGQLSGVLEVYHRGPMQPDDEWLDYLETLAGQAAISLDNIQLFNGMQRSNQELSLAYDATIEGWSRALDLRDRETEGHTQRVTEMTLKLGREFGFKEDELVRVRWGALLHDIGKMGVPDSILLKPDKLTDEEWELMRRHPVFAYEMLKPIQYLKNALDIPYCHHEKWDGTGYPRGLKGEQIPLAARIFAVVDIWDALRSDRPYRPKWSEAKTLKYIKELSGTHLDPQVVDKFFETKIYK